MPDRIVITKLYDIHRMAELYLPERLRDEYIRAVREACTEIIGSQCFIHEDRFMRLRKEWGPKMRSSPSPMASPKAITVGGPITVLRENGEVETVPSAPCNGCGGGNAVHDVAMARTPAAMEQAILDA